MERPLQGNFSTPFPWIFVCQGKAREVASDPHHTWRLPYRQLRRTASRHSIFRNRAAEFSAMSTPIVRLQLIDESSSVSPSVGVEHLVSAPSNRRTLQIARACLMKNLEQLRRQDGKMVCLAVLFALSVGSYLVL